MADDERSDAEANAADNDGLPLFTAQTPTPRRPADNPISKLDAKIQNAIFDHAASDPGFAYRDVRGQYWNVRWNTTSFTWNAYPLAETARVYNAQYDMKLQPKKMYAAANDAAGMVSVINERVESARVTAGSAFPWWLLVVGYLLMKGKRR